MAAETRVEGRRARVKRFTRSAVAWLGTPDCGPPPWHHNSVEPRDLTRALPRRPGKRIQARIAMKEEFVIVEELQTPSELAAVKLEQLHEDWAKEVHTISPPR